jgi:trans-aconitate methyltransferase
MNDKIDNQQLLSSAAFQARDEYCVRFTERIVRHVNPDTPMRILDLGCGTGSQIFDLARALPAATFVGVDISELNVEQARKAASASPDADRMRFVSGDYMQLEEGMFDLIVSYSTLHLIPVPSDQLLQKLSRDLVPGGLLVNAMPYACTYNTALIAIRKIFRQMRGKLTDRLLFALGRALTPVTLMDDEMLRERVIYMYLLPYRLDGSVFRQVAERCGLHVLATELERHASVAQTKHNVVYFRRQG